MLIRICLIAAIVLSLGVAGVNFFKVKDQITTTIGERDQNARDRDSERSQKVAALKDAKDTHTKLTATTAELTATKAERDTAVATAADATKRADADDAALKKVTEERDDAQNQLAAWKALGIPIEAMRKTLDSLKLVSEDRDAIALENKVLNRQVIKLQNRINQIIDPDNPVELPEGLTGKVLVTDPLYGFVVLNIGDKQGVLEDGQMLVNRNGRLIAKVKIKSVQQDRSIANVMPGWSLGDIMEGDEVLY
jgi:hypothetical protein